MEKSINADYYWPSKASGIGKYNPFESRQQKLDCGMFVSQVCRCSTLQNAAKWISSNNDWRLTEFGEGKHNTLGSETILHSSCTPVLLHMRQVNEFYEDQKRHARVQLIRWSLSPCTLPVTEIRAVEVLLRWSAYI